MDDGVTLNESSASWDAGEREIGQRVNGLAPDTASPEEIGKGRTNDSPTCSGIRLNCGFGSNPGTLCADYLFLHERHFQTPPVLDFLQHCRTIRQYVDQGRTASTPLAYLKDVLNRLPTQPASKVAELLPHRWQPEFVSR